MCNSQLKALLKKNLILMKRSPFTTACEIFFPIILMAILALVRSLFQFKDLFITVSDTDYLKNNTAFYRSKPSLDKTYYGLPINPGL